MIVGFTSLLVLTNYNAARVVVQSETAALTRIYELAQQLPEAKREEIQGLAESYARAVVEKEWPLMRRGRFSPRAQALSDDLRSAIQGFEPTTTTEQIIYTQELNAVNDLDKDRETRLLDSRLRLRLRLPPILWVALVGLTICMLLFSWLLGVEAIRLHMLGMAALMAGIVLVLCTIFVLERPYGTASRIQPQPFEVLLHEIEGTSPIEGASRPVSMPEANYPT